MRLAFRTNNIEKMAILPNGNIGVGVANPELKFQIHNSTQDNHLHISGAAPSIRFSNQETWGTSTQQARMGLAKVK